MSPSHRAEEPAGPPEDDPDGSAPAPPDPDELDLLVDRLAATQAARDDDPGPDQDGPDGAGAALVADELTTLAGMIQELRDSVRRKADGFTDAQASTRMLGSATTVTGIVRHLADVERYWFREIVGGVPEAEVGYRWWGDGTGDDEWVLDAGASLAGALEDYAAACDASRAQLPGRDPDEELRGTREARTLRWVLAHMLQETARHVGHLDVLAELLDGRTGE